MKINSIWPSGQISSETSQVLARPDKTGQNGQSLSDLTKTWEVSGEFARFDQIENKFKCPNLANPPEASQVLARSG